MAFRLWTGALLVGLVVILLPEPPKQQLVPYDGWKHTGGFVENDRPRRTAISSEIAEATTSRFFRNWTPEGGVSQDRLESAPFVAPRFLVIPVWGFPSAPGTRLFLERVDTRDKLRVMHGNVPLWWSERTLWLGSKWRGRMIRLVVQGKRATREVGVGTPYAASALTWLKDSVFVAVVVHAAAFVCLLAPGAALVLLARRTRRLRHLSALWMIPTTLLVGFAAFFIYYASPLAGRVFALTALMACVLVVGANRRSLHTLLKRERLREPLALMFLFSLFYVCLLYSADAGIGTWAGAYRYEPPAWSSDNQLPQLVAEGLVQQTPLRYVIGGGWQVSDRPPVLAGFLLLARPFFEPFIALGNNSRFLFLPYQILGIVASTFWVVPVWRLFRRILRSEPLSFWALIVVGTSGFAIFHSSYISPKMLAAALGLLAVEVAGLWRREGPSWSLPSGVATAAFAALAILSHSGVVFGFLPCIVFTLTARPRWLCVRWVGMTGGLFILIVTPWILWQRLADPPGNALTKYAFAGTYGFEEREKSLTATVEEKYQGLSLRDWLDSRWQRFSVLAGAETHGEWGRSWIARSEASDGIGRLRGYEGLFLLAALGPANLGWPCFFRDLGQKGSSRRGWRLSRRLVLLGIAGVAINIVPVWGTGFVFEHSLLSVLAMIIGLYGYLFSSGTRVRRSVIVVSLAYTMAVWVIGPFLHLPARLDFVVGASVVAGVVGLWGLQRDSQGRIATMNICLPKTRHQIGMAR